MNATGSEEGRPGQPVGAVVLVVAVGLFALAGGTFAPWSVVAGMAGAIASVLLRLRAGPRPTLAPLVPVLLALAALSVLAVPSGLASLAAGGVGIAFLLWLADDPARRPGGARRAGRPLGLAALAVAGVWTFSFLGIRAPASTALAVAALAVGIVLLAVLLGRLAAEPSPHHRPPPARPDDLGLPFLAARERRRP